jgi:hypothetical protein
MMGSDKASTIRQKLRAAFAREGSNPIPSLDRRIRQLEKEPRSAESELRSLRRLRRALAQVIDTKPPKRVRPTRAK